MPLSNKKKLLIRRWVGAILIALGIGTVIYWFATRTNKSATDLYAAYYQPKISFISTDSVGNRDKLAQLKSVFAEKDFSNAVNIAQKLVEAEPSNQGFKLALGLSQLELGDIQKAKQSFSVIDTLPYQDEAQWYLAMIFLRQSDIGNAQTILENIDSTGMHYQSAKAILEKL